MKKTSFFLFAVGLLICLLAGNARAATCYCSGGQPYLCTGPGNTNCLPNAGCMSACSQLPAIEQALDQEFLRNDFNVWQTNRGEQSGNTGQPGHSPGYEANREEQDFYETECQDMMAWYAEAYATMKELRYHKAVMWLWVIYGLWLSTSADFWYGTPIGPAENPPATNAGGSVDDHEPELDYSIIVDVK